jgi:Predicted periplasmic ligand-binding sensor domain
MTTIDKDMDISRFLFVAFVLAFIVLLGSHVSNASTNTPELNENSHTQFVNVIHYDQYNGLLGEKVTQIDQDHLGYMWIATHQGLNRFDSQSFTHFTQDSLDADSLPSNAISLFIQTEQEIWLSLNNMGLARYQKHNQKFTLFPEVDINGKEAHQGIFQSMVFALAADQSDNIWVFQFDGGISVFNQQTQQFSHLTPDNTDWLQSVRFFDAKTAADGHIWAVTLEGIVYDIDPRTGQAVIHDIGIADKSAKEARIYSISINQQGILYLGAYQGVYRFDAQQNKFTQIINRDHISQVIGGAFNRSQYDCGQSGSFMVIRGKRSGFV